MADAVSAAHIENSYFYNPGNFNRDTRAYMNFTGYFNSGQIQSLSEGGGCFSAKYCVNQFFACAAAIDYDLFEYNGSYPDARGLLWSEVQALVVANLNIFNIFAIGLQGKYYSYSTDASIYGKTYDAENGGDMGVGVKGAIKLLTIGAGVDNILSIRNHLSRRLFAGIGFDILNRVQYTFDFLADMSRKKFTLKTGLEITLARNMLFLHTGIHGADLFRNTSVHYGITLKVLRFFFSYGGNYNFNIPGSNRHFISVAIFFNYFSKVSN
ncbi:MAG TPA: hypothetical protein DC049_06070 [Spirochaetia bacterium]|nr:hypothetical protein [Spirochaetia bacterium]